MSRACHYEALVGFIGSSNSRQCYHCYLRNFEEERGEEENRDHSSRFNGRDESHLTEPFIRLGMLLFAIKIMLNLRLWLIYFIAPLWTKDTTALHQIYTHTYWFSSSSEFNSFLFFQVYSIIIIWLYNTLDDTIPLL